MREKCKKELHNLIEDNRGVSLVTVIVVIGFIAILVSVLMMTSLVNFKMKKVGQHGAESFYSAEKALDEINVGLQKEVSWALGNAYSDVLSNYSSDTMTPDQKDAMVWYEFASYMSGVLGAEYDTGIPDPSNPGSNKISKYDNKYSISYLENNYLKASTRWDDGEEYGAFLRANRTDRVSGTLQIEKYGDIVLKDLTVYYKDNKGYVSIVKTDIRIRYPEFVFSNPNMPDITSYSFIADGTVEFDSTTTGAKVTIAGDTYSGNIKATRAAVSNVVPTDAVSDTHIVKNKIYVKEGSFATNEASTLWASDLETYNANFTLKGNTNVMDDLNVKGKGCQVTIGGIYNGYGADMTDSNQSSAILINGANTNLDLSGVDKITIGGHAYLGTKSYKMRDGYKGDDANGNPLVDDDYKNTVMTGESIAVKSNQLMYLVPAECLWVSETTGESVVKKNPVSSLELRDIETRKAGGEKFTEVSDEVVVSKILTNLQPYIAYNGTTPAVEKLVVKTTGTTVDPVTNTIVSPTYTYYYMSFKDEDAANTFFRAYYGLNSATYNEYTKFYLSGISFPRSLSKVTLAGNSLIEDKTTSTSTKKNYRFLGSVTEDNWDNKANGSGNAIFTSNYKTMYSSFRTLCTKLTTNPDDLYNIVETLDDSTYTLNDDRSNKCVFKNLVNTDAGSNFRKLTGAVGAWTSDDGSTVLYYGGADGKGTYSVTNNKVQLVIAYGNVDIGSLSEYKGTIICYGDVKGKPSAGGMKLTADPATVSKLLMQTATVGDETFAIASVFRDNADMTFRISSGDVDGLADISDLVVYDNWSKE